MRSIPGVALVLAISLGGRAQIAVAQPPKTPESTGLIPLTDMTAKERYKGQDGGLYGGGRNTPPELHLAAALKEAAKIQPLDAGGKPSPDGKVVLISLGMSNTTMEFRTFVPAANADPDKSPKLVIVDGAQGRQMASYWARPPKQPDSPAREGQAPPGNPWAVLQRRLQQAGVTPQQVQVAWMKHAEASPVKNGEFPGHAERLQQDVAEVVRLLKQQFPNLRIAYVSSRIYAGHASKPLNPEPFAYESAFAMRWLIQEQIKGTASLNYDPAKGEVKAPLLLWGPYLWADGIKGRKSDELVWKREDLGKDGTHPSPSGSDKVSRLLLEFFKSDPTARTWFLTQKRAPSQ